MLAQVVEDRHWFFFEIYQKRGTGMNAVLVRIAKAGPFRSDVDQAKDTLRDVRKEHPSGEIFGYTWVNQRWVRWP